jgi:hypothetical protein
VVSSARGVRGGNWNNNSNNLSSSNRNNNNPTNENNNIGFRVASPGIAGVAACTGQNRGGRIGGFPGRAFTGTTRFSSAPARLPVGK